MKNRVFKRIGSRLAKLRDTRGLTQEQLHESSGVPRRTIQNIEHGSTADPGLATVVKLLNAMNYTLEDAGVVVIRSGDQDAVKYLADVVQEPSKMDTLDLAKLLASRFSDAPPKIRAVVFYLLLGHKELLAPYLHQLGDLLPSPSKK